MPDREPSTHVYPLIVSIPTTLVMDDARHLSLGSIPRSSQIFAVEGHLRVLTLGSFQLSLRDMMDDTEFGRIAWSAAGDAWGLSPSNTAVNYTFMGAGSGIKINVVGIGTGAVDCTLLFWVRVTI